MKRFIFVIFVICFFSVAYSQDIKIGTSSLPPSEMRDVNVEGGEISFITSWDVYVKISDGTTYKKLSESYVLASFPKTFSFNYGKNTNYTGNFVSLGTIKALYSLNVDNVIKEVTSLSGVSITQINGVEKDKIYIKINNLPENFSKVLISVNFVNSDKIGFTMIFGIPRPFEKVDIKK